MKIIKLKIIKYHLELLRELKKYKDIYLIKINKQNEDMFKLEIKFKESKKKNES